MWKHVILCAAFLAAAPAPAQERLSRIGILSTGQSSIDGFRASGLPELARHGFVEGRNLSVISRSSDGNPARLRQLAAEILAERPDVVVAVSNPVAAVLTSLDPMVPVVMGFAGTDPAADGLARSLSQPGGRVTGVVMLAQELDIKRLDFAREMFPQTRRFGVLVGATATQARIEMIRAAARQLGVDVEIVMAGGPETFDDAFEAFRRAGVSALVVASFPGFSSQAAEIVRRATSLGVPALCEWRSMAEAGCLISYGANDAELRRQVAGYVARILRGEAPADMAMQQASRFEFVLNRKAAQALGVSLSPMVLMRADEVID